MKDLSYFMKRPYKIELIEDTEEGGYTAALPELPGCLTCGKTMDEALANLKDAKKAWLSAALEDGYPIPINASTPKGFTSQTSFILIALSILTRTFASAEIILAI